MIWIVVVAALLAGVVAVNVAVLGLNLRLDDLNGKRAKLRADNAVLASRLASAAAVGRTEIRAQRELGLVSADPSQTLFIDVRR